MDQSAQLLSAAEVVTIRIAADRAARCCSLLSLQREPAAAPESALLRLFAAPAR
jgi:hypothetical protein